MKLLHSPKTVGFFTICCAARCTITRAHCTDLFGACVGSAQHRRQILARSRARKDDHGDAAVAHSVCGITHVTTTAAAPEPTVRASLPLT